MAIYLPLASKVYFVCTFLLYFKHIFLIWFRNHHSLLVENSAFFLLLQICIYCWRPLITFSSSSDPRFNVKFFAVLILCFAYRTAYRIYLCRQKTFNQVYRRRSCEQIFEHVTKVLAVLPVVLNF